MQLVKRIGGFFQEMLSSCYDMDYYRGVRTQPLGKSFGYAVALHVFIMIAGWVLVMPSALALKSQLLKYVEEKVPADASITFEKGQMSTSLSTSYEMGVEDFSFVVDSSHEGTQFPEQLTKPGLLLGRDAFFIRESETEFRTYALKDLPDQTFTQEQAVTWLSKSAGPIIVVGVLALGVLYWVFLLLWSLMTVALYSLFAMGVGSIAKVKLSYGQWYAVGLHAITLPLIGTAVLMALRLHVPFAHLILYFLIIAAVITDERNNPVNGASVVTAAPATPTSQPPAEPPASNEPPTIPPTTE